MSRKSINELFKARNEIDRLKQKLMIEEHRCSTLVAERDGLAAELKGKEPVAWAVMNGWATACISSNENYAKGVAKELQKKHDLSGSIAAYRVVPLIASSVAGSAPLAPLIANATNESVHQRLLEAQRLSNDDLERMAQDAGFFPDWAIAKLHAQLRLFANLAIADFLQRTGQYVTNDASREAALAQAKAEEREACAKECRSIAARVLTLADICKSGHYTAGALDCVAAIRARGQG